MTTQSRRITATNPSITNLPKHNSLGDSFSPTKAGKAASHIIFVLDESSSMYYTKEATISGYNEYLDVQKKAAKKSGIKTFVSLYKFNGEEVRTVTNRVNIKKVDKLTNKNYAPSGMTNLYDAIGGVMSTIDNTLVNNKKKNRDSVIITVLTDGEENMSQSFNQHDIKQMIEKAESKNWGFMFLGANIDASSVGNGLGFNTHNTIQYTMVSQKGAFTGAASKATRMSEGLSRGANIDEVYSASAFTDEERKDAVTEDE